MSFDDFRNIGSSRERLYRNEKFDIKENNRPCEFMISIKASGSPNAKALKWFVIALGVLVSAALVIGLVVFFVVFTGHGHNNDGTEIRKTTQKETQTTTSSVQSTTSATVTGNGTWSNWGPWTMCAVTCGNSVHSRYRTCINNNVNDRICVGSSREQKECTTRTCPVYGIWTTWQSWTNCGVTCGGGTQRRSRACLKNVNTDINCVGSSAQQQTCNTWACPDCSQVCVTGSLNSDCDACECSTSIQGQVSNANGGPLHNVSIAHESAPHRHLVTTSENGIFELNSVCNQNRIILKKSGYQDTTVMITASTVTVVMHLIQFPVITTQPKSHLRLEGEFVEFCCNASGNPPITSYEWLKNGNLVNESLFSDGTTLRLRDLKFEDSGTVICRANSPAGAVFSDPVSLSVRANHDDFCSDAYEPHTISLPSDCIQPDTNSVEYDIGQCSPKDCRKINSNVEQSCSVDKRYCCAPNGRERRIVQCTGYSFPLYVTTSCTCSECEDVDITIHGQAVGAKNGLPLRFGTIEIDGKFVASTGIVGDFSLTVRRGTTRIAITFKDTHFNQFIDTLKIMRLNEEMSGSINIHVKMIEKPAPIDIDSTLANTLQMGDQNGDESIASIKIPPKAIFYPNGTLYNGVAKASLNFFDPRNSFDIENAPGEFVSVDDEGQTRDLQSFGVFALSLQDQSGSNLQIAGETEIKLDQTFFETSAVGNLSDVKLWGMNSETGIWEEQARLSIVNNKRKKRQSSFLVGTIQINAYRWYNIDQILYSDRCYFKTKLFKGNNQLKNYIVRTIVEGASGSITRFSETYVHKDTHILTMCKNSAPSMGYIGVERNGIKIPVDTNNSGLDSSAESFIDYKIMEDGRTISANMRMSSNGPFYAPAFSSSFGNIFRFKLQSDDYSLKVLNPSMIEAIQNNYSGHEVWYPPLNSFMSGQTEYRSCFIKVGTVNAGKNLAFRVISTNNETTILGIHEKRLTKGATCIEYRCSGRNPDFNKFENSDFFRYPKTYTLVRIIPINQICTVSSESGELREHEQKNMNLDLQQSNVGENYFDANIPDTEYDGIFFHKSVSLLDSEISKAREFAIKECNSGVHSSSDTEMNATAGLATVFTCQN